MPVPQTYGLVSRLNHWIIAIAMIGMIGFGLFLEFGGLERGERGPLAALHRSIGVLVLIYAIWRVALRILQGFPGPVASSVPAQAEIPWIVSLASGIHGVAGKALAILILIHISAALKHHFWDADTTLTRMITGKSQ